MLSIAQGKKLVQAARKTVTYKFEKKNYELKEFEERSGVFVTIHSYPGNELKGCIGYPEPVMQLNTALVRAATAAAFSDPRFMPLQKDELNKIIFEVSVLTKPELIKIKKYEDYKKEIKIGRDGLIAEQGYFRGLLLPQVAVEWKWDVEQFLNYTCEKAGLPQDSWKNIEITRIYKFQSQIFREKKPNGEIIETKDF